MCLATLTADKTTKRIGYKVVYPNSSGGYYTGMCGVGWVDLPVGMYVTDPNKTPLDGINCSFKYPAGFHICLNKREANIIQTHEGGVVRKVRFRKSVAVGTVEWKFSNSQHLTSATIVAREVMLLGEDT